MFKFEDAEAEYRAAIELKPNYTSAHCHLALLLATQFGKVCLATC